MPNGNLSPGLKSWPYIQIVLSWETNFATSIMKGKESKRARCWSEQRSVNHRGVISGRRRAGAKAGEMQLDMSTDSIRGTAAGGSMQAQVFGRSLQDYGAEIPAFTALRHWQHVAGDDMSTKGNWLEGSVRTQYAREGLYMA